MERKATMLAMFGLNVLFYLINLVVLYKRYLDNPYKYILNLNFEIFYSFALSLLLMIPAIASYFVLFNYWKNNEKTQLYGTMLVVTLLGLVFLTANVLYSI